MATLRASIDVSLVRAAAFELVIDALVASLRQSGIQIDARPGGRIMQGSATVGEIVTWIPGDRVVIRWRGSDWDSDEISEMELRFEPAPEGTRVVAEHQGWGGLLGGADELAAWFGSEVLASLFRSTAPLAVGDWLTDRGARSPSGARAREIYGDPLYHYPNFRVILAELGLTPDDYLLEVGCGGGALLREALKSGCRAAAIDHSSEMVRLARDTNRGAVNEGRLKVLEGDAADLPFPDSTFTRAAMTGVLGFLPDPVAALAEIRRVLAPGGRFVSLGSDPELKGTPAAPEPMASRLRFYDDDGLEALAREAGFEDVRIAHHDLEPHARKVGIPEEHVPLFAGDSRFLITHRR